LVLLASFFIVPSKKISAAFGCAIMLANLYSITGRMTYKQEDSLLDPELIALTTRERPLQKIKRAQKLQTPIKPLTPTRSPEELALSQPLFHWELQEITAIEGLSPMQGGYTPNVTLVKIRSDLFNTPVIVTSDLHKDGAIIFSKLKSQLDTKRWEVILCGDMAGTPKRGEDASITPLFDLIQASYKALHFVYGNHDIAEAITRHNEDGSPCKLDRAPRMVGGKKLCGVSGVFGTSKKRHRVRPENFLHEVKVALQEEASRSILCTHDTPALLGFTPPIGQEELTKTVSALGPAAHFFGHCHLKPLQVAHQKTLFVDVDARVLLIEPC
jgi:Icc-related predicted phosphoesterase